MRYAPAESSLASGVAGAGAAPPTVTHLAVTNQLDPIASANYSDACGVPVEDRDTGRITQITHYDKAGNPTRTDTLQSLTSTFTNPNTGATITLKMATQVTVTEVLTDTNGSFTFTATFRGLDFVYRQADGTSVSAGRGTIVFSVVYDASGNVISESFTDVATRKLMHSTNLICPALGGTAP